PRAVGHVRGAVAGVTELGTRGSVTGYSGRPVGDQWRAHATQPREALPQTQRGVARPCPAPGIVVVRAKAAELVHTIDRRRQIILQVVGEAVLVEGPERTTFSTRAVVGNQKHQRVLEEAERGQ